MTQYLPPNLLALFAPRDPIPYFTPLDKLPHEKKLPEYHGVGQFQEGFEDPKDTPPATVAETKDEKRDRKRKERQEQVAYQLEQDLALWDPSSDPTIGGDAFKTLFVGRINYDTSESKLRREFEVYGPIRRLKLVYNKLNGKPRGYAFIEYEHERDMHSAYKHADGKKIDGRRVLVDVERGRTIKGWRPRRLGGGLGGTRKGGPDVNTKFSGREDSGISRDRSRSRERGGGRRRSRSPRERKPRINRSRSRDRDRSRRRDDSGRDRKRGGDDEDEDKKPEFGDVQVKIEGQKRKRSRSPRGDRRRRSRSKDRSERRRRSGSRERRRRRSRDRDGAPKVKSEPGVGGDNEDRYGQMPSTEEGQNGPADDNGMSNNGPPSMPMPPSMPPGMPPMGMPPMGMPPGMPPVIPPPTALQSKLMSLGGMGNPNGEYGAPPSSQYPD